ncbi:PREDICTED: uncharacterized protein LOC104598325 [Nelumbo nucifera]|uniref:Methyltransferase type 11 domain-containing protein n=2 Tax=Nelumbo nucifera TaxID=4432 RepID=A0A822ZKK3_NELNU|nr:PREDICTED: uncharacterized protein LOC104598325 [Nelumbo nucifera]DAD43536.1 TPA_asm: hypothetical protein HUJ06_001766 [Nelumbo nucifera]
MALKLFKLQLIYHNFSYKSLILRIFLLSIAVAAIPCFNLVNTIDVCDSSWTIETVKLRMNVSDLEAGFGELMTANWLVEGNKALSIGRDSARAVMVMKRLGFADAIGVYRSCSSLFRRGGIYGLQFGDGLFDFVFSTEMIDGVRVPARLVLEMERVLRPGGVGVVMRRLSGSFPATAVMKAAAPVGSFLRSSDVVGVRTINCTVMVVFKKRDGDSSDDMIDQKARLISPSTTGSVQAKSVKDNTFTKMPPDLKGNYIGSPISAALKLKRRYLSKAPFIRSRSGRTKSVG